MYYYIHEPDYGGQESLHRRVRHLISLHGITGEMTLPSPTSPLEDLVIRAADKGYNTIVAVGGDRFVTQVAKLLAHSDIALGVIPIGASPSLHALLGVKTLEQAIQSLKQRKISELGIGVVSPSKVFLVSATIAASKPTGVVVASKTFRVEGTFTHLTIERQEVVSVRFRDWSHGPNLIHRILYWFVGRTVPDHSETVLRAPTLSITTAEPLPVTIAGDQLAQTPCKVRVVPAALKLIQARASMENAK